MSGNLVCAGRADGFTMLLLTTFALAGCAKAPPADRLPSAESSPAQEEIAGDDWPGFLGPLRDGKSSETGLSDKWPASGPPILWHKEIGVGYAGPAISQGRLFHFAR